MPRPTGNGWSFAAAALALVVLGARLGYPELIALGAVLAACLLLAVRRVWARSELRIARDISPARVRAGDPASALLSITNGGDSRCPPLVATEVVAGAEVTVLVPSLAPGARHDVGYDLPTQRRGRYEVGPLRVGRTDPLRLLYRATNLADATHLWVHPLVHPVRPIPTGHRQEVDGPTSAHALRGGVAFHSLRDYVPGDDPRLIHWPSSARAGTLVVRHSVVTHQPRLEIVLDTSATPYPDPDAFEDAVRIAASLVVAGADHGFPTTLHTTAGTRVPVEARAERLAEALDELALVEPSRTSEGLAALVAISERREPGRALGVVTGRPASDHEQILGVVRGSFEMVTTVHVGAAWNDPTPRLPGVLGLSVASSEDFVQQWRVVQ